MPIALSCPACQARVKAPDAAVGHTLKCPACKHPVPVTKPATPTKTRPDTVAEKPGEEVYEDFEVVGEKPAGGEGEQDFEVVEDEASAAADGVAVIEHFERVADDAAADLTPAEVLEDVMEAELVEDAVDVLEEVREADGDDVCAASGLLRLPKVHVRGQSGLFEYTNAYKLYDPQAREQVGEAREVQEALATAARVLGGVGRSLMPTKIEVVEGRHHDLLLTVRRSPHLWKSTVEILDADDRVAGSFQRTPWSQLRGKPMWIEEADGRKRLKLVPQPFKGKCVFQSAAGEVLGEMVTESAYEGAVKIYWFSRGGSYYVLFKPALAGRPRDKLLFLGAALGLDLLQTEDGGH